MEDSRNADLHLLTELAREYEKKYEELQQICQTAQSGTVLEQLRLRSDLTTDNFRAAQMSFFELSKKMPDGEEKEESRNLLRALSRSFDEMRILFNVLLEQWLQRDRE